MAGLLVWNSLPDSLRNPDIGRNRGHILETSYENLRKISYLRKIIRKLFGKELVSN